MTKKIPARKFLLAGILICFFLVDQTSAQTIKAIQKDLWSKTTTWDLGRLPIPSDTVLIDGHEVTLDISATIAALKITNAAATDVSGLKVKSDMTAAVLVISGDVTMVSENVDEEVKFNIESNDSVYVGGHLYMTRSIDNDIRKRLELAQKGESRLTVNGDFHYSYQSARHNENYDEIDIAGNSVFRVKGNAFLNIAEGSDFYMGIKNTASAIFESDLNLTISGGDDMLVEAWNNGSLEVQGNCTIANNNVVASSSQVSVSIWNPDASMHVDGDLSLSSIGENQEASITASGGNVSLSVRGDINLDATSAGAVGLNVEQGAEARLGGSINRMSTDKFGFINMEDNCNWVYDGDAAQIVACTEMPSNGIDAFDFSNVKFENTSGEALTLEGPLEVNMELVLTEGILLSSTTSTLIINQGAVVTGGSESSYVDGPVTKVGQIPTEGFTFPLGDNGTYAPLRLGQSNEYNAEYTATYSGCPPPLGGSINTNNLTNISGTGFWEFERTSNQDVDIYLHWTDASAQGITDPNDLVVARYDDSANHWTSNGNGGLTAGAGSSGSITHAIGCPPPLGGSLLTIGSESGNNPLPVVMRAFNTQARGEVVVINWETTDAFNADYFIIEKASNGINFEPLMRVDAVNARDQLTTYAQTDFKPFDGNNYYRLCQVDLLGMKVFSEIQLVSFEASGSITVFPNPVEEILHVKGNFESSLYEIEVYDETSRLIRKTSVIGEKGYIELETQSMNLPKSGLYLLHVRKDDKHWTVPFLKV